MTDDSKILIEHFALDEEISRDESTITYKATDLRSNQEIQIKLLTKADPDAAIQFIRAAQEAARKNPVGDEMCIAEFGCTKEGKFFTTCYQRTGKI